MMADLFQASGQEDEAPRPLADRLRPQNLAEVAGQDHLLGEQGTLGRLLAQRRLVSIILWGPPGSGKTSIARLLAHEAGLAFESLSAIFSGVADLRKAFAVARQRRGGGQGTLFFVDEIHRFNRAQQDSFLPFVEEGVVTLVGATTENPSFELNAALLSRCQVFVLKTLDEQALETLLQKAESFMKHALPLNPKARHLLLELADGDGRYLLNLAEEIFVLPSTPLLDEKALLKHVQRRAPRYDKDRDEHYNLISALHKSIRGSDPDAALYWLARMMTGGEDPLYLARRLVRIASEDIGLADPSALLVAEAAKETYRLLGSPEGDLALAHAAVHMATAPKSNALYKAFNQAMALARKTGSLAPPSHSLNAPTGLMKQLGYGVDYAYDHDQQDTFSGQNYFPDGLKRQEFYQPQGAGREKAIKERLEHWKALRRQRGAVSKSS